jgi:hypothetical protein
MRQGPSHNPGILKDASLERIDAARRALNERDPVMCFYLGGLAIECILQAVVQLDTPTHDQRHHLAGWLGRCRRTSLQRALNSQELRPSWNHVCAVWRNEFRYYSRSALLGTLKKMGRTNGVRGDHESVLNEVARRFHQSVVHAHNKGLAAWKNYTKK